MIELEKLYYGIPFRTVNEGQLAAPTSLTGSFRRNGAAETDITATFTLISTGFYQPSFTTLGTADGWATTDHLVGTVSVLIGGVTFNIEFFNSVYIGSSSSSSGGGVIGRFDDPDADSPNVTWKVGEVNKTKTVICVDANDDPIDLEADFDLTDAYLVIERANPPRTDVQVIAIADITIGGADGNELTFQANADVLEKPGDFKWSFRQDNESEIACGRITVSYSPMRDA